MELHGENSSTATAIIETEGKTMENPVLKVWVFSFNAKEMKTLQTNVPDCKDFSSPQPPRSGLNNLQ
jgi:hypothetical protein